jgi:hypothetical protein
MQTDQAPNLHDFYDKAAAWGFRVYDGVAKEKLKVVSVDEPRSVLRYFSPELRPLPGGTQIGGVLGIALRAPQASKLVYDVDIFHHILNYRDLIRARRIMEEDDSLREFFLLLKEHLCELPADVGELLRAAQSGSGWIAQQFKWNDPELEDFKRRLTALQ